MVCKYAVRRSLRLWTGKTKLMLPPPPALIQPSSSRSSKGPRSGQEQMSRAAGPHVRTYPPRRRHRSPGAVSSTPTADPFVHPGASTTAYVASARSPPRAVAPIAGCHFVRTLADRRLQIFVFFFLPPPPGVYLQVHVCTMVAHAGERLPAVVRISGQPPPA